VARATLEPASTLTSEALAALLVAGYEGYGVPMDVDAAAVVRHVGSNDIDLAASRIALGDDGPVGVCLLALRGDEAWVGGMGVVVSRRREGIGEALMHGVLAEARRHGARRVRLEVLEQNDAARLLYEKLGFVRLRDVCVWTLEAEVGESDARDVPAEEAHAFVREHRLEPAPWQRADETLARLDDLVGVALDGGAAVYRVAGGRVLFLQAAARDEHAAIALLRALRARGTALIVLNLPETDVCAGALARLGARLDVRQHEMALDL
jgi:GNAT superfamily N-acetyltransferase